MSAARFSRGRRARTTPRALIANTALPLPAYPRYSIESTRGNKHYVARVAVERGRLFVLTAQTNAADYDELADEIQSVLSTFEVRRQGPA